jgi:serine/threonine-protein kinase RsbW
MGHTEPVNGLEESMPEQTPKRCDFVAQDLIVKVDMTLAGDVKAIDPAVEKIMSAVREMSCGDGKEFEIETAIREALANAIVHGCQRDRELTVRISVGCDQERGMIIVVKDPGAGFDPAALPNPVVGEAIYSEGGRGIFLINQLMDEVRFRDRGTEIWMRKS